MNSLANVEQYLKENGIRPSYQRVKVYEYLSSVYNHPSVDTIYKNLVEDNPSLSKTTVYNTLDLFVKKGIASMVVIEEKETRYDANVDVHGHFKCTKCDGVYDVPLDKGIIKKLELHGYEVDERHIYFKGTCKSCLTKKS